MNISALRTYALLQSALFQLLTEMPFEKITLTRLCARSMVPRSTFYRYFEDKYDLLRYCLRRFFEESRLDEDVIYLKNQESTQAFIAKVIAVISRNKEIYRKICQTNKNGIFMDALRSCLVQILTEKLEASETEGLRLNISRPIFTYLLADLFLSVGTCYLEYGDGYAVDALDWSIENGLIEGMGDGTVAPQDGALRGQMAAVLMRLCENIAK